MAELTQENKEQAKTIVSLNGELESVKKQATETEERLHFTSIVAEFGLSLDD